MSATISRMAIVALLAGAGSSSLVLESMSKVVDSKLLDLGSDPATRRLRWKDDDVLLNDCVAGGVGGHPAMLLTAPTQ